MDEALVLGGTSGVARIIQWPGGGGKLRERSEVG